MPKHSTTLNPQFSDYIMTRLLNDFRKPVTTLLFVLVHILKEIWNQILHRHERCYIPCALNTMGELQFRHDKDLKGMNTCTLSY